MPELIELSHPEEKAWDAATVLNVIACYANRFFGKASSLIRR